MCVTLAVANILGGSCPLNMTLCTLDVDNTCQQFYPNCAGQIESLSLKTYFVVFIFIKVKGVEVKEAVLHCLKSKRKLVRRKTRVRTRFPHDKHQTVPGKAPLHLGDFPVSGFKGSQAACFPCFCYLIIEHYLVKCHFKFSVTSILLMQTIIIMTSQESY